MPLQLLPAAVCQIWSLKGSRLLRQTSRGAHTLVMSASWRAQERCPGKRSSQGVRLALWTSSCALSWQRAAMLTLGACYQCQCTMKCSI